MKRETEKIMSKSMKAQSTDPRARLMAPILYRYTEATRKAYDSVPDGTVAFDAHRRGIVEGEPLIVGLDALIRYAQAYKKRFDAPLADDGVLGPAWLAAAQGLRALLNGDGTIAMERGITTDSKDNGACEAMFWSALAAAGFEESDL